MKLLPVLGLACCLAVAAEAAGGSCPDGYTVVEASFDAEGTSWTACEDLSHPGGEILLVPAASGAGTSDDNWGAGSFQIRAEAI